MSKIICGVVACAVAPVCAMPGRAQDQNGALDWNSMPVSAFAERVSAESLSKDKVSEVVQARLDHHHPGEADLAEMMTAFHQTGTRNGMLARAIVSQYAWDRYLSHEEIVKNLGEADHLQLLAKWLEFATPRQRRSFKTPVDILVRSMEESPKTLKGLKQKQWNWLCTAVCRCSATDAEPAILTRLWINQSSEWQSGNLEDVARVVQVVVGGQPNPDRGWQGRVVGIRSINDTFHSLKASVMLAVHEQTNTDGGSLA